MKTHIPLDRLKRSRDSGSALYNMHPTGVLGRAGGGGCPRTSAYNSEILQSESLAEVSCPISSIIDPFLGRPNSHISNDAYKLKVEKLKFRVLGRAGGEGYSSGANIGSQAGSLIGFCLRSFATLSGTYCLLSTKRNMYSLNHSSVMM